jgi:hypothetical protein
MKIIILEILYWIVMILNLFFALTDTRNIINLFAFTYMALVLIYRFCFDRNL